MKETYNYSTKAKARAELRNFVQTIYPKPKQRRELRVLSLLGHEPHELEQVWDPLGVPRGNILCIESEKEPYEIIKANNWGVRLPEKPISLEEFVEHTPLQFDVINIDGTSPYGFEQRNALRTIASRRLFGDKGILATWNLGMRESNYVKAWFEATYKDVGNEKTQDSGTIKDRSDLISRNICSILIDGILSREVHPYFLEDPTLVAEFLEAQPELEQCFRRSKVSKIPRAIKSFESTIEVARLKDRPAVAHSKRIVLDDMYTRPFLKNKLEDAARQTFGRNFSQDSLRVIAEVLFYAPLKSYFTVKQERLRYAGDRGSTMLVDINYCKQVDLSGVFKLELVRAPSSWLIHTWHPSLQSEALKLIENFLTWRYRCYASGLAPRKDLGSAYGENIAQAQESTERELSDDEKQVIRELCAEGESLDSIASLFDRSVSRRRIGSIAAWVKIRERKGETKQIKND